ncbi:carboxymuconolactone decarboxylase family protein [Solimonas marina]|uniref:Carboxymuconolactone decarboxylase family protein n=1 Tax=Solimonas marina TaxID=2714601 RepID=A0A969W8V7_9GAMM|nr:carboxymuconolactone decarboxylase family protein [Solimonas marina]NKF21679.1 carboxymuconolactone decarboxylase family protein [Solimonas marina]
MQPYRELTAQVSSRLGELRADMPDLLGGFNSMARAATKPGALDTKSKELIALALGVAARCDACIGFHMRAVLHAGASKTEIEEALGMAVYMGGGPSLMYAANAMNAYAEFTAAQTAQEPPA